MPGRLRLTSPVEALGAALDTDVTAIAGEPARKNIAPGQEIIVYDGALKRMRWGMIPVGRKNARGRPVMETIINARSETLFEKTAFKGVKRAIIPVDGWYEWTGEVRRKTAWLISSKVNALLYFAAITDVWKGPGGIEVPQVAAVTCEPNADVRGIHHRMGVLLTPKDIPIWLTGSDEAAKSCARPWPDGRLKVEKAEDVDWSGP